MSPRSFIVLEDSNDYARCSRDTKFKSIVLREIRAADDSLVHLDEFASGMGETKGQLDLAATFVLWKLNPFDCRYVLQIASNSRN